MRHAFPEAYFSLSLKFAGQIARLHQLDFSEALFLYSPLFVRLIGFRDDQPPQPSHPDWQAFLAELPKEDIDAQTSYTYQKYLEFEERPKSASNQIAFGCFAYSYHQHDGLFELHFRNVDPQGNLSASRQSFRRAELIELFSSMQQTNRSNSRVFLRTWLLNIEAFTRLFPPMFIQAAQPWNVSLAQDNSHWGQFVDKEGNLKQELADQLLQNTTTRRQHINDYFPLPCLRSEVSQQVFYEYFSI